MTTPPIDPAAVVLRIRTIVDEAGTIPEVCQLCGVKQPTLESILYGKTLPGSVTLAQIARGLKVDAHWILFGKAHVDA